MVSSADPAVSRRDFAAGETGRGPFIPTNRASNPRAGQWTNAMSHNMIADYKRFLMTDGEGIRCSLYVSGCPFHCEGCYNSSIWDFRAGHEYNDRLEAQIMADLSLPYVQGITFLGVETTRSDAVHSRNLRQGPRRRGGGGFLNGFERFVYGRLELGKLTIFVV